MRQRISVMAVAVTLAAFAQEAPKPQVVKPAVVLRVLDPRVRRPTERQQAGLGGPAERHHAQGVGQQLR